MLPTQAVADLPSVHNVPPTDDVFKYELGHVEAKIMAIWNGKEFVEAISENSGAILGIIMDKTNFYSEQGGQIHDTGDITLVGEDRVLIFFSPLLSLLIYSFKVSFKVTDVQSFGGYVLHMGSLVELAAPLAVGDLVELRVEHQRRASIMSNHTSTHMVNFALRNVLGGGVEQKGSLVDHNRFR